MQSRKHVNLSAFRKTEGVAYQKDGTLQVAMMSYENKSHGKRHAKLQRCCEADAVGHQESYKGRGRTQELAPEH